MVPRHPLERLSDRAVSALAAGCALTAAVCLAAVIWILPGRESAGVVDFVEARTPERAREIAAHWSEEDRVRIAHAVGLDYLMNPAYMTVAAALCVRASRTWRSRRAASLGRLLAWVAWSVVVTNALENVALLMGTLDRISSPWPALATFSHYWAGGVVAAALLYVLAALGASTWRRATRPRSERSAARSAGL